MKLVGSRATTRARSRAFPNEGQDKEILGALRMSEVKEWRSEQSSKPTVVQNLGKYGQRWATEISAAGLGDEEVKELVARRENL